MKVNTERLEEQANGLRVIAYRMREIQDSVLRTSRILSRESVGERFRIPIQNAAASVEKRYEELMRMQSALRDIANIYERSEREILDEAEHANIHHDFNLIRVIALPVLNVFDPVYDHTDWFREQDERFHEMDRIREEVTENPDIFWTTSERNGEQSQSWNDVNRLWEAVSPRFGRGLNPIPEIQLPDPIDVGEFFPTVENGGIQAAPGMDRVIESIAHPVGPSASSPLDVISGPAERLSGVDTNLGSSGAIDWTPWNP